MFLNLGATVKAVKQIVNGIVSVSLFWLSNCVCVLITFECHYFLSLEFSLHFLYLHLIGSLVVLVKRNSLVVLSLIWNRLVFVLKNYLA